MGRLDAKVALISGAAKGMGAAHSRAIVAEGGKVVLGDILVDVSAALAEELGGNHAIAVGLDVTRTDHWQDAVEKTMERFGRLDVLVNNAGVVHVNSIDTYEDADWYRVMDVNAAGTFKGIRAVLPAMKRSGGGSIINISSVGGLKGFSGFAAYVSSKFAVRGLTKVAALEFAKHGIRVNSIHPGYVATDMATGVIDKFDHVAMNRIGTSEEITKLMLFLASQESSFCTGAEFIADGGETCGIPDLFG